MHIRTPLLIVLSLGPLLATAQSDYFAIRVVDADTDRGVPLVELRTVHNIRYYTDSAGLVAFNEPGLMNDDIFFFVTSDGYEYPADGFGMRGTRLAVRAGEKATVKLKRLNIAERLYRVTGGGIYRDSVLLGRPVPIAQPLLNGQVIGQDSVLNVVYQGRLFWIWGDTSRPQYPLGNFHAAGATSQLPSAGGLDPNVGVNLDYFVREGGFAQEMAPRPEPGPVWLDALVTLPDDEGQEHMFAAYARVTASMEAVERGFMRYNDDTQMFEKIAEFDAQRQVRPGGHPFRCADCDTPYLWFPTPFPLVRVRADAESYLDVQRYECWTPLKTGSTLDAPQLDRDESGRIRYAWRTDTPALSQDQQNKLVESGLLKPEEAWIQLQDVDTGKPLAAHSGSVYWNAYRQRWITIRCEMMGTSMLGETWYAEADTPLGPWVYARKIVTHRQYSFYNPKQHPEFDQANGRIVYFEGTYANTFSGNPTPTPRYDYNQIMYRLDLDDPRLNLPVPVYRIIDGAQHARWVAATAIGVPTTSGELAFFALDRKREDAVPVYAERLPSGNIALRIGRSSGTPSFYALPAQTQPRPATCVPLYEYVSDDGTRREYGTDESATKPGFQRTVEPLCLVWRNPLRAPAPWPAMRAQMTAK